MDIITLEISNKKKIPKKYLKKLQVSLKKKQVVILKNILDPLKLKEIKNKTFEFGKKNKPNKKMSNFAFIKKSLHRIDDEHPQMRVKCVNHVFRPSRNDKNFKSFFEITDQIDEIRNSLLKIKKKEYRKSNNGKGYISRPTIKHYPIGGGYMSKHTDKVLGKHSIQVITPLSEKFKDYKSGGLKVKIEKNWHDIDAKLSLGSIVLHRPDLEHKVDKVNRSKKTLWGSISGKWSLISNLDI